MEHVDALNEELDAISPVPVRLVSSFTDLDPLKVLPYLLTICFWVSAYCFVVSL